jgi:copper transporter 1
MLWNWDTVDSCFLASSWHNKTKGAFAGSVIGVFLLVILIEGLRRLAREYDRKLVNAAMARHGGTDGTMTPSASDEGKTLGAAEVQCRPPFQWVFPPQAPL